MTNGQQASSPYYGLPLGSIFYSSTATQGEVYVSDSRRLIVVNFQHGGEAGCSSFMVGPPAPGLNISSLSSNKDGVILPILPRAQPKRRRRQTQGKSGEKIAKPATRDGATVIQLGEPKPAKENALSPPPPASQPQPPVAPVRTGGGGSGGGGIAWSDQAQAQQPPSANAAPIAKAESSSERGGGGDGGGGIRWADSSAAPQDRGRAPSQQPDVIRLGGGGDGPKRPQSRLRELPIEYIGGINVPDELEGKANPNVTHLLNDPFNPDRPIIPLRQVPTDSPPPSTSASQTIQFGGKRTTAASTPSTSTQEPTAKTFRGLPLPPAGPSPPGAAAPGDQQQQQAATLIKLGGEGIAIKNATGEQAEGNHTECGNGWCVVPDPRRHLPGSINATTPPPSEATTQQPSNRSNPFVVVDDRRAQFLPAQVLALQQQQAPAQLVATIAPLQVPNNNNKDAAGSPIQSPPPPTAADSAASRYAPPVLPQDGKTYLLPRYSGDNVIVSLPEPYELSEFQWFGIYDHCKRVRTAFVNVRGIKAPKEVKLEGLRGWQYDVSSGDIYVKNCNTLKITNFTFSGAGKTEAYIYVGNGVFPHSIIQKGRAYIDGTYPDRSLKNFNNDDVLVRLPNGWKTFDITWIAVFNPKGNVSYGHVLVPPLVVPACEELK